MLPYDGFYLAPSVKIREDPGKEPYHKVGLQLQIVETRLDYMGSSMLMGRMCDLDIVLKDEWRLDRGGSGDDDLQPLATKRWEIFTPTSDGI